MNCEGPQTVPMKVDNDGTIDTAKNTSINQCSMHIDLQYQFVRDAIQTQQVILDPCNSEDQAADPLTKPLDRTLFEKLRSIARILRQPF